MGRIRPQAIIFGIFILISVLGQAQHHSVAREWNEALLNAIRKDNARPTVHARNLWHTSVVLYDAWAAFTPSADCFFLGDTVGGYIVPFDGIPEIGNRQAAQEEAMSYAAYRLLKHRFKNSPGKTATYAYIDSIFTKLGYDPSVVDTNYTTGNPAALGNYLAQHMISFGLQDGANEQNNYASQYYQSVNAPLAPALAGNPDLVDPNRWQPLSLDIYIDQSGNVIPGGISPPVSPEWGHVVPFSLKESEKTINSRDGDLYPVYHNPPTPPYIDTVNGGESSDLYRWNFSMVAKWSSHLDPTDSVVWDISPAGIGNLSWYPTTFDSLPYFYDYENGGDRSEGHDLNPETQLPYTPQMVARGDYARVLAEFWADGPDSETPPGHWFTILNYVHDHPLFERKWKGQGPVLADLEWDVKAYLTLSGAVHDVAVTCWGIKGWYDYVRPVSAFRYMADQGQCSDSTLDNYSINGLALDSGFIEVVDSLDPIAGSQFQNVGKLKVKAWMGPDFVLDPATDAAGVDWILAENWWPYQRPSFVTPPFPGYMSGHSTFSRASAEVMTLMTGTPYFPGGMGEFHADKNEFLFFEEGPSEDIVLQWATYRDASDQCSLSRIWGGIHPPVDDIPGRLIGMEVGPEAFEKANSYWEDSTPDLVAIQPNRSIIADSALGNAKFSLLLTYDKVMDTTQVPITSFPLEDPTEHSLVANTAGSGWLDVYTYASLYDVVDQGESLRQIDVTVSGGVDVDGKAPEMQTWKDLFQLDTENPFASSIKVSSDTLYDINSGIAAFELSVTYSEKMDTATLPEITFPVQQPSTLTLNADSSGWVNDSVFVSRFDVASIIDDTYNIDVLVQGAIDMAGNVQSDSIALDLFSVQRFPVGIRAIEVSGISLYPNPVQKGNAMVLVTDIEHQNLSVQLVSMSGSVVFQQQMKNAPVGWELVIPTDQLATGKYFLEWEGDQATFATQVIVR